MKSKKLLLSLLILVVGFSSYAQNPFTEMLNDPGTRAIIDSDIPTRDQVILDDLIVDGSACVGQDCNNGENFGFDTVRLKENNLRIGFTDTSSSASFPSNDWEITINDSSNGGSNYFGVTDVSGGRRPFTVMAGARANSLFVSSAGRLGLGTATPVTSIHTKDGNTPTLRLEQDGSSGFTSQTWDVAGNEAGFFVRDATNGSTLPFRIKPGAPSESIFIQADGNVNVDKGDVVLKVGDVDVTAGDVNLTAGNANVVAGDVNVTAGSVLIGTPAGTATRGKLHVTQLVDNNRQGISLESSIQKKGFLWMNDRTVTLESGGSGQFDIVLNPNDAGNVGIGVAVPTTRLDVNGVITTPGGNSDEWNAASLNASNASREMEALQSQVNDLMARMEAMESCGCYKEEVGDEGRSNVGDDPNVTANRAYLSQNIPNPFDNTTDISYFVPFINSRANIVISNAAGQILENRSIDKFGEGSIVVNKARMSTGIYFYTLYADGKKIDTKRMVVE